MIALASLLGQTRIFYVMARDKMLPPAVAKIHPRFKTPVITTMITGVAVAGLALIIPLNQLLNLANPAGGDGLAYFVVDAINRNTSGAGAGNSGLLAVTGSGGSNNAPEPATLGLIGVALAGLGVARGLRKGRQTS